MTASAVVAFIEHRDVGTQTEQLVVHLYQLEVHLY